MTKSVPTTEFEENVHALVDDVIERGDEVLLTKDGRPVAKIVPMSIGEVRERAVEKLRGSLEIVGDIVSPIDDLEWEVEK